MVTESLPKGAAAGPLPTASCLVIALLRDRTRCFPFLTCDTDRSHVKLLKKEDYFLLFGKSLRYLVPARFVPQVSQRMSVLGLLVSSLLYFVDQPYISFWQASTTLLPFWSSPTFFSGFLVCSLGTDCPSHAQNVIFH